MLQFETLFEKAYINYKDLKSYILYFSQYNDPFILGLITDFSTLKEMY
jgi:hypothetical protein